ncbi:MAG: hypothetical protein ACR2P0_07555 [Acidimicrobiales bacterium]
MAASTTSETITSTQRVRFRCLSCEVAWTAEVDSTCWVCDEPGLSLRAAYTLREDDYLHLDFE